MKKIISIFLLCCCISVCSSAQTDSTSLIQRDNELSLLSNNFAHVYWESPVAMFYAHEHSFTDISLAYQYRKEDSPLNAQNGDGENIFDFTVKTYQKINEKSHVWAEAGYQNGEIKNIMWNSTSDYSLLYPYIMADTIGGDMKHEKYSFNCGYSHSSGHITWAATINFKAQHQYRQIDPRPRNITSDLILGTGIGLSITPKYILSLSVHARLYHQTNNVTFYNELGITPQYNMNGLGSYYARFSGDVTNMYYKANGYNANISFFSKDKKGISAYVDYEYFGFKRIALDLNKLPLTQLNRHTIKLETNYVYKGEKWDYGMAINGLYSLSLGSENIIGDGASSIFPIVGQLNMYNMTSSIATAKGFFTLHTQRKSTWSFLPKTGFDYEKEKYNYPTKNMSITNFFAGMGASHNWMRTKTFYKITINGEYHANIHNELSIPMANMEKWAVNMVKYHKERLSDNHYLLSAQWYFNHALKPFLGIVFSANYTMTSYHSYGTSHCGKISIGLTF